MPDALATPAASSLTLGTACARVLWVQAHSWGCATRPRGGAAALRGGRGTTAARGRRWVLPGCAQALALLPSFHPSGPLVWAYHQPWG